MANGPKLLIVLPGLNRRAGRPEDETDAERAACAALVGHFVRDKWFADALTAKAGASTIAEMQAFLDRYGHRGLHVDLLTYLTTPGIAAELRGDVGAVAAANQELPSYVPGTGSTALY